ncbi:hypothetical protein L7F22_011105 [Adiantum nelumboides]|nr:hypothetical protein [Adiantum nelumboides]
MDHEGHSGTPQVSPVKAINLNAVFSPYKKMQSNKYVRRRMREASQTPILVKRLSKAARTRAALVDKDEMYAYVKKEMAKAEARMLECMTAFKSEMMGEMHALGTSMYAKWKEEMQTYSQQEMAAQLKAELVPLEGKIHAFMAKDMLKLVQEGLKVQGKAMKEACKQEVSIAVDNEIQKSKEAIAAMEASVSKVQENVEKNVHTWAEMAKDAVDKEVKECAPWIEVVKKNKGMPSNQMEVMNVTLEEEAKCKAAMYDTQDETLRELDPCDLDMHRMAQDAGDVIDYGETEVSIRHLLLQVRTRSNEVSDLCCLVWGKWGLRARRGDACRMGLLGESMASCFARVMQGEEDLGSAECQHAEADDRAGGVDDRQDVKAAIVDGKADPRGSMETHRLPENLG